MSAATAPVALPPPAPAMPAPPPATLPIYRLSVEQYQAMIRASIFEEGDRVELLDGLLVKKMSKNPPHRFATQSLRDLLVAMLPPGWFVDDQEPIATDDSVPEPDLGIYRGRRRDYLSQGRHPGAVDAAVVVEVSDSSLSLDRRTKAGIYARAGYRLTGSSTSSIVASRSTAIPPGRETRRRIGSDRITRRATRYRCCSTGKKSAACRSRSCSPDRRSGWRRQHVAPVRRQRSPGRIVSRRQRCVDVAVRLQKKRHRRQLVADGHRLDVGLASRRGDVGH